MHDNARPHIANVMKRLLDSFLGWDFLNHFPYFPELVPSDYHLFTSLNIYIGRKKDEEVMGVVNEWTKKVTAQFYETGIKKN